MRVTAALVAATVCSASFANPAQHRTLTFEDRVRVQEAIERVYYAHQVGAAKAFEAALPRSVLESKVRKYLDQSVALTVYWKTAVTDEMLQRELERMTHGSRMPERLIELYAALGNDSFLIKECLARATLVDRLTHNFHAFDQTVHAEERRRAEDLRQRLENGNLSAFSEHPNRSTVELVLSDTPPRRSRPRGEASPDLTAAAPSRRELSPDDFRKRRAQLPKDVGEVSSIKEERDAFMLSVILSESSREVRVAIYVIPKTTWDDWWSAARLALSADQTTAVASDRGPLPMLTGGLTSSALPCSADDTWDNGVLDDPPDPRSNHTAVWTGSQMVVWGGISSGYLNTGARYDPATDSWTPISTVGAPSGREFHSAIWTGTQMVVWGGQDEVGPVDTGGRYDPTNDSWTPTSTSGAPSARGNHTAVWTGSQMVVWGGTADSTGGRYDPATDSWTPTSTADVPVPRFQHTAVWTGNLMIVWGGSNSGGYVNSGGRYNPTTDSWTPTSTTDAPTGRVTHSAVWTGSRMVVWGGFVYDGSSHILSTGGQYDPSSDSWTPTSTTDAPSGRVGHSAAWAGSLMVVWGGNNDGGYLNSGGRYDPANDRWLPTSTTSAPSARGSVTAVWTGSLLVIWGGYSNSYLNTGGRYDPATDNWTPTFSAGAPAARAFHTAVWTGSLMVVWGGASDHSLDSGGRYDPATDTWTPTSTANAPSERISHTAVWTGSLMVVWGGFSGQGWLNTGGRYNPATDTWTPTSTATAPSARADHTAVWTGSSMVVWGGFAYDGSPHYLDTGARYNPSTDSWTPSSAAGAPSARSSHTAVWTGSRMVVWGGFANNIRLNTGGRYNPATDSWTPMSAADAPSERADHTAVWTGSLMVVWGGNADRTGGRYNPATDVWTPMSTTDAPAAYSLHTAVWTGSRMTVWGGQGADRPFISATGGRYDPATNSWTPTSTTGAPAARTDHTAVWTGGALIVWGGAAGYPDYLNSGGRYVLGASVDDDGDGYSECQGDCNDGKVTVHPGAPELCNGVDDNCNGLVDDGGAALCDDGNPCTDDSCDPSLFCRNVPNDSCDVSPRGKGFWKRLCAGPHRGESITQADVECVNDSCTFASVHTLADLCDRLNPNPSNDKCEQAEAQFMALMLNHCQNRLTDSAPIVSQCTSHTTVGSSRSDADAVLCSRTRNRSTCTIAKCESEELNSGRVLVNDSLRLAQLPDGSLRLTWGPPYGASDLGPPHAYVVRRRTGSKAAYQDVAVTQGVSFVDITTAGVNFLQYDVTPVW